MKVLFNRFKSLFKRAHSKTKVQDPRDSRADPLSPSAPSAQKEKLLELPLREWPQEWPPSPPPLQLQRDIGTPTSITSYKPLPELSSIPLPPIENSLIPFADYDPVSISHSGGPLSDVAEDDSCEIAVVTRGASPCADQGSAEGGSRKTDNGSTTTTNGSNGVPKKVAFLCPLPPSGLHVDHPSPEDASTSNNSTVFRSQPSHPKHLCGSMSTTASGSRPDVGSSQNSTQTVKATSTRSVTSTNSAKPAYGDGASIHQSLRSATPFSQKSIGPVLPPASWSEAAEKDLVNHLGPRERARQEVLWEIVASEERYVAELIKMKDTFIVPLLHPYVTSPVESSSMLEYEDMSQLNTPAESLEHLPIASRFVSPLSTSRTDKNTVPFPSRFHESLPPPPRPGPNAASTQSLSRQSFVGTSSPEKERDRDRKSTTTDQSVRGIPRNFRISSTQEDVIPNGGVSPHQLPDDLRQCLEVIEDSILAGHLKLSEGFRIRYDKQYPLVRSLADVFVANSHILRGYANYVLHLERALEQVNDVISTRNSTKHPKNMNADEWLKVCAFLRKLENDAQDRGETGLAISLSKPFQRLLKYPLLFQNLLFHTDPSTFEYDGTLHMVTEAENIVRSIEAEKIQKEERDKTRDILARIEGLNKIKQLAVSKPSRILMEERMLIPRELGDTSAHSPVASTKAVRGKTSFKSLSDVLQDGVGGIGGKKDMWLVVFNDVTLLCQRTGTTSLPLGAHASKANSLPELQDKSRYTTTGRRNSTARLRNLYKFIKIENWTLGNSAQPPESVASSAEVFLSRVHSAAQQPRIVPMPDEDRSKFNFSNRGPNKITRQKPSGYSGESLANAKFGHRLVFAGSSTAGRSGRAVTPSGRHSVASDEGDAVMDTRQAWDGSTCTLAATSVQSTMRSRTTSQNSATTEPQWHLPLTIQE